MITIDTLKIKTPLSSLNKINHSLNWNETINQTKEGITKNTFELQSIGLGFKSVKIDKRNQTATFEMSSKILQKDYFNLISLNTIEQVSDIINSYDIVELNKQEFISNYTEILKSDFCQNLKVSQSVNDYFPHLLSAKCNHKYTINNWNETGNKGVEIRRNVKSQKVRQIFYNKLLNLEKDKQFFKHNSYNFVKDQFKDILRVECNATSFKTIKDLTGSKTNRLIDVLTASEKPNLKMFNKSMEKVIDMSLFEAYDNSTMSLYEIEKREGRKGIIQSLNYDPELIASFINKHIQSKKFYQYVKEYRELANEMLIEKGILSNPYENKLLNEIRYLLAS